MENSQAQVEDLRKQLLESQASAAESMAALEVAKKNLERALPFEMEVKEKNLLIGKLRHEAVILNDHLTKALRHLKKGKPDDNIDKFVRSQGSRKLLLTSVGNLSQTTSCIFSRLKDRTLENSRYYRSSPPF